MTYEAWEGTVPVGIREDAFWRIQAYRLSLYAGDIAWVDVTRLARDRRTVALADQIYRAIGSIGANIAEGYSRGSGRDRARFLEYAPGSARESRDWYYKARHVLGNDVACGRIDLLSKVIRLLLVMIPDQRTRFLNEAPALYQTSG